MYTMQICYTVYGITSLRYNRLTGLCSTFLCLDGFLSFTRDRSKIYEKGIISEKGKIERKNQTQLFGWPTWLSLKRSILRELVNLCEMVRGCCQLYYLGSPIFFRIILWLTLRYEDILVLYNIILLIPHRKIVYNIHRTDIWRIRLSLYPFLASLLIPCNNGHFPAS